MRELSHFGKTLFQHLAFGALFFLVLFGPYLFVLFWSGEFISAARIARLSRGEPMLWCSGFYDTGRQKLAVAKNVQPVVAIFGSSRVMQLRSEFFRRLAPADFYNLGGCFGDVYSSKLNTRSMLRLSRPPKLIIFGLDHWWFEQDREAYYRPPLANRHLEVLRQWKLRYLETHNDVSDWLTDRMVIFQQAWLNESFYAFLRSSRRDPLAHRYQYGLYAYRGGGFRNDGSHLYWKAIQEQLLGTRRRLDSTTEVESILRGKDNRYLGNDIQKQALLDLDEMLADCRARGITVIGFLPPILYEVQSRLKSRDESRGFWQQYPTVVRAIFEKHQYPLFDFTNPHAAEPGADADYFIDVVHGGEGLYGKILMKMGENQQARNALSPYVDFPRLEADLAADRSPNFLFGD